MATVIRPELSKKNKYWISKHRYYELKYLCLQYPSWKKAYAAVNDFSVSSSVFNKMPSGNALTDMTAQYAIRKAYYSSRIKLIEKIAMEADKDLWFYILKAVTEGHSYTYLKSRLDIPCSRDTYYDRYRKFFWLLSESRD